MRPLFILLSLAYLCPAEAQQVWKYEVGLNVYESGSARNILNYFVYNEFEMRFNSDLGLGTRFKVHNGNSAYRLGIEFYRHESEFPKERINADYYYGEIDYRQIEFNLGYQYALNRKRFSAFAAVDIGYTIGKAVGEYGVNGWRGNSRYGGPRTVDDRYIGYAISPVAGLTIKPFTRWSLTLESRYQFANWYIDYPDGGTKKQYYPDWFPISTLSLNYQFGKG